MGICELCGSDRVGVHKTRASGAVVEACSRCIESLGLELHTTPPPPSPPPPHHRPRRTTQNDIMPQGTQALAQQYTQIISAARKQTGQ